MAVSVITSTESQRTATTDPWTFSATIDAACKGLALFIGHGTESADIVTGAVTVDSKPLGRVMSQADTTTEPGRVYVYWLGHDMPTSGSKTVSIDLASASATDIEFVLVQFGGDTDLELVDCQSVNDETSPSLTMGYNGRYCTSVGILYSGVATVVTDAAPNGNMTNLQEFDIAAFGVRVDRQTTPGTSDFAFSYTFSDDSALSVISVSEKRPSPFREYLLTLSPAVFLMLNEPVGCLTAFDSSSNIRNASYNGGLTLETAGGLTGDMNTAVLFNGTTGYVSLPDNAAYSVPTNGNLSVLYWSKFPVGSSGATVQKYGASNYEWGIESWGSTPNAQRFLHNASGGGTGAFIHPTLTYDDSLFHFGAMTFQTSNTTMIGYIDGVSIGEDTVWEGTWLDGNAAVELGRRTDTSAFYSYTAQNFAIFPSVLTPDQIGHLHTLGRGRHSPKMNPMPQLLSH